jgi:Spy/CpxP family protein refolding chaperone
MTRFRSLTGGLVIAGLLAGGVASAQGPGPGRPGGPAGRGGRGGPGGAGELGLPLAQLNLTDAQRQQIRDLTQRRLEAGAQVQERLRAALDARRKATEALPVNEGAIRATTADLVAAETEVAILQAHLRAEVVALLTPEQQDQLKKVQAERAERLAERRDRTQARQQR